MRALLLAAALLPSDVFAARTPPWNPGEPLAKVLGICVHNDGRTNAISKRALGPTGLKMLRMDVLYDTLPNTGVSYFNDEGRQILGIMAGEKGRRVLQIFDRDPEAFIDRHVLTHPFIDAWEFSNEPDNFAGIPAEEYVRYLRKAYAVFERKYPEKTLLSAAPMGNNAGAKYFDKMVKAGLFSMPNLVIALHMYDADISKFSKAKGHRIWITEIGDEWPKHLNYFNGKLARVYREYKPERIYWYAHWEDKPVGKGNGWISIDGSGRVTGSPLYNYIVRAEELRKSSIQAMGSGGPQAAPRAVPRAPAPAPVPETEAAPPDDDGA